MTGDALQRIDRPCYCRCVLRAYVTLITPILVLLWAYLYYSKLGSYWHFNQSIGRHSMWNAQVKFHMIRVKKAQKPVNDFLGLQNTPGIIVYQQLLLYIGPKTPLVIHVIIHSYTISQLKGCEPEWCTANPQRAIYIYPLDMQFAFWKETIFCKIPCISLAKSL